MSDLNGKNLIPDSAVQNDLINLINEHNLKNYNIKASCPINAGDCYVGSIVAIEITGQNQHGEIKKLNYILKHSPRTGSIRNIVNNEPLYRREIFFYTKFLPELYKLQKIYNIKNGFMPVAKIYKFSSVKNDEYALFEDKKLQNFRMSDRKQTFDLDHSTLVVKQLGYFHGLSYVWKKRNYLEYKNSFEPYKDQPFADIETGFFQTIIQNNLDNAVDFFNPETETEIYEKMKNLRKIGLKTLFMDLLKSQAYDEKYSIPIHGDCWNNNILFKYNEANKPVELCLLDWQLSRIASPVIDLIYFIYQCTGTALRESHFDNLLQDYYHALSDIITKCDENVEEIFPLSIFNEHISKYSIGAILYSCHSVTMFVRDSDEIPEFQTIENMDELTKFHEKSKNHDILAERIRGIVLHGISRKFL